MSIATSSDRRQNSETKQKFEFSLPKKRRDRFQNSHSIDLEILQPARGATSAPAGSRRKFMENSATVGAIGCKFLFMSTSAFFGVAAIPLPSIAKDNSIVVVEQVDVKAAFDRLRQELVDGGGIPYMTQLLDQERYTDLLEFTRTYDLILRKGIMGKAKKMLSNSSDKDLATQLSNNITFDLIGINRNIRPNQINSSNANRYLDELRQDIERFLTLEPKF